MVTRHCEEGGTIDEAIFYSVLRLKRLLRRSSSQ